jgi:hypothetical protein
MRDLDQIEGKIWAAAIANRHRKLWRECNLQIHALEGDPVAINAEVRFH